MRSKADFKALRELVGMSRAVLADRLDVSQRSVRRWESPDYDWQPPQDAWDVLDEARKRQLEIVTYAVHKIKGIEREMGGTPEQVDLTYWHNEEEYIAAHPDEGVDWQMANANSRLVAHELERLKYRVSFNFPGLKAITDDE